MSVVVAWVVFPLVLAAVAAGCGLLVERLSGGRLPGVLVVPLGLAALVAVSQVTTYWDATAELTSPLVVLLAVGGFVLARARIKASQIDLWSLAVAVGVFGIYGAPVVLSGQATFAGYNITGDTGFQFVGVDYLLEHGRRMDFLPPSSYEFFAKVYFGRFSPAGAQTALGAVRGLVGQDVAWVYTPYMAFLAGLVALALSGLLRTLVDQSWLRAGIAFLAAQSSLMLGYVLQGQIKEIGAVAAITLVAALVPAFARDHDGGVRRAIPLAVASAAALGVLGIPIVAWIGPLLLAAAMGAYWSRGARNWRRAGVQIGLFVLVAGVLAFPALLTVRSYFNPDTAFLSDQSELGNLKGALSPFQVFGIWLAGDYRGLSDGLRSETFLVLGVAAFSAVLGVSWVIRRRAWSVLLFAGVSLLAGLVLVRRGSPYADAKTLMILSPAVLMTALLGVPALLAQRARLAAGMIAAALTVGVIASSALAYHEVNLAPKERFSELGRIGERFAGQGPTLYTEFDEMNKHFLRATQPEGASEAYRRRGSLLRNGDTPKFGTSYDLDDFPIDYVTSFPTVVVRRSPARSRPPASYRQVYSGRSYEVWQRTPGVSDAVRAHLPFGSRLRPEGPAKCGPRMQRLAAEAEAAGERLAFVERRRSVVSVPTRASYTETWGAVAGDGLVLAPSGPGQVASVIRVDRPLRGTVWLLGSVGRGLEVKIDGRTVGRVSYKLNGGDGYVRVGDVALSPGRHRLLVLRGGGDLRPGNGSGNTALGPLVVQPGQAARRDVQYAAPADWRRLCGRPLDWVERVSA